MVLSPTKSCPRLRGKCRGVAVTKGKRLKLPSAARCSPSVCSLSLTDSSPVYGESGCECNEQTEGLQRSCYCLRQPLSHGLRRASSLFGEPFSLPPTKKLSPQAGKVSRRSRDERGTAKAAKQFYYSPSASLTLSSSPAGGGAFLLRLTAPPPSFSKTPRPGRKAGCAACRCGGI